MVSHFVDRFTGFYPEIRGKVNAEGYHKGLCWRMALGMQEGEATRYVETEQKTGNVVLTINGGRAR